MIAGTTVPLFRVHMIRSDLAATERTVVQALERAEELARVGGSTPWGFHLASGTFYQGSSYSTRNPSFDEIIPLPADVKVAGVKDISFAPRTGTPSVRGMLLLTAMTGDQRVVPIGGSGL